MPPKLIHLFVPDHGAYRWRVSHGGRGSGKSYTFALMAALRGYQLPLRILCTREMQNSIRESMHAEIRKAIDSLPWLANHYDVGRDYIRGKNGTEFIFKGLRHNIDSIKSMSGIDLCIVEEAETVPHESWRQLIPTVRDNSSEFWVVFNPRRRDSFVAQTFMAESLPPRCQVVTMNHSDNPWFPSVLEEQRKHDRETIDPALYRHVWEGDFYERSAAQVFAGRYEVKEFDDPHSDAYHGLDFGFSQDPTAAIRCLVHDKCLYITHDFAQVGLELDDTAQAVADAIPGIRDYIVRADNARPESISYLKRNGLPRIIACKKGAGSVEEGIKHLLSYKKIIVHPRCMATIKELDLYSYKVDRLSGDVLPVLVDAYNHNLDALRYAVEPLTRNQSTIAPVTFSLTTGTNA